MNNIVTEAELDKIIAECEPVKGNNGRSSMIADKNIDPTSHNYGRKGESFYLKNGDQWYIKYRGDDDFTRIKWWALESNVCEADYGKAIYKGINASIRGREGRLAYISKKWIFILGEDKYILNNPESVSLV